MRTISDSMHGLGMCLCSVLCCDLAPVHVTSNAWLYVHWHSNHFWLLQTMQLEGVPRVQHQTCNRHHPAHCGAAECERGGSLPPPRRGRPRAPRGQGQFGQDGASAALQAFRDERRALSARTQRGRGQEVVQADHFAPASGWPSGSGRCCPGVSSGFGVLDVLRAARGAKERAELAEAHLEARRTN